MESLSLSCVPWIASIDVYGGVGNFNAIQYVLNPPCIEIVVFFKRLHLTIVMCSHNYYKFILSQNDRNVFLWEREYFFFDVVNFNATQHIYIHLAVKLLQSTELLKLGFPQRRRHKYKRKQSSKKETRRKHWGQANSPEPFTQISNCSGEVIWTQCFHLLSITTCGK